MFRLVTKIRKKNNGVRWERITQRNLRTVKGSAHTLYTTVGVTTTKDVWWKRSEDTTRRSEVCGMEMGWRTRGRNILGPCSKGNSCTQWISSHCLNTSLRSLVHESLKILSFYLTVCLLDAKSFFEV